MSMTDTALPAEPPPLANPEGVPMPSSPPPDIGGMISQHLTAAPMGGAPAAPQNWQPVAPATTAPPPAAAPGPNLEAITRDLAAQQAQKVAEQERLSKANTAARTADQAEMRRAYQQAGAAINDIKPWDADAAREKFRYDPVQEFGSIGSVFAILASSFTSRPMENAMYGAAAAMEAVREGNKVEYDRAFKAWQENMNLAVRRQSMLNQQYSNAQSMMTTNMQAGRDAMTDIATRYGDKRTLTLLQNGMDKEALDYQKTMQEMTLKLAEAQPKIILENLKVADLYTKGFDPKNPNSPASQAALMTWQQQWNGRSADATTEIIARVLRENPEISSEDLTRRVEEITNATSRTRAGLGSPTHQEIERRTTELMGQINPKTGQKYTRTEAYDVAAAGVKKVNSVETVERSLLPLIEQRTIALQNANPTMSPEDARLRATAEVKAGATADAAKRQEAVVSVTSNIDRALDILRKYEEQGVYELSPAGAGGMLQRGKEFVMGPSAQNHDATQVHQYQRMIQAQLPGAMSIRGKMNLRDRADFDAMIGATPFTNVQQAITRLEMVKKQLEKQEASETQKKDPIPLPSQYSDRPDGTKFPLRDKSGNQIGTGTKRGNVIVPD